MFTFQSIISAIQSLHLDEYYPIIHIKIERIAVFMIIPNNYRAPFQKFIKMICSQKYKNLSLDEKCEKISNNTHVKYMRIFTVFNKFKMDHFSFPNFVSDFCKVPLSDVMNAFHAINMKNILQHQTNNFSDDEKEKIFKICDIYLIYQLAKIFSRISMMHDISPDWDPDLNFSMQNDSEGIIFSKLYVHKNKSVEEIIDLFIKYDNYNGIFQENDASYFEKLCEIKQNVSNILVDTDIKLLSDIKNNNPDIDLVFGEIINLLQKKPRNIKKCMKMISEIKWIGACVLLLELVPLPKSIEDLNMPYVRNDHEQNICIEI